MRRTALAIALLLASAPVARAETPVPTVQPDLQVVQTVAPTVRQEAVSVAAAAETRKATTATVQRRMSTTTIVILALAVIGALVVIGAVL
jgi:hypothetical protein